MSKFKFLVPAIQFRLWLGLALIVSIIATIADYTQSALATIDVPQWIIATIGGVAMLAQLMLGYLVLLALWKGGAKLLQIGAQLLTLEEQEIVNPQNLPPVDRSLVIEMQSINDQLEGIISNQRNAYRRLGDIEIQMQILSGQVVAATWRVTEMRQQEAVLSDALAAIITRNQQELAPLAGTIQDDSLRRLLLMPMSQDTQKYWADLSLTVGNYLGSMRQCSDGYSQLVTMLLAELSNVRAVVGQLEVKLEAANALEPLMRIKDSLQSTRQNLAELDMGPGVAALPGQEMRLLS